MFMAHLSKNSSTSFQNRWTRRSKAATRRKWVCRFVKSGLSSWIELEWFVITFAKIYRSDEHTKNQLYFLQENSPALTHSTVILVDINNELCNTKTNDTLRKNVSSSEIDQTLNHNQTETKQLANLFKMKLHVRVILTVNIDLQNRLIDVQSGTVKHIAKYMKLILQKYMFSFMMKKQFWKGCEHIFVLKAIFGFQWINQKEISKYIQRKILYQLLRGYISFSC